MRNSRLLFYDSFSLSAADFDAADRFQRDNGEEGEKKRRSPDMFDLFYLIELRNEQQTEYYKQRNSFFTPKKKGKQANTNLT